MMMLVAVVTMGFTMTSCSDDDSNVLDNSSIEGRWVYTENYDDEGETLLITMELVFNRDKTGYIIENYDYSSRASSKEQYRMDFSWSTTQDSNGNDLLKVSYMSGDKNTELFYGSSGTVLWTRQFVLTGAILNIYEGDGVWVFNRK